MANPTTTRDYARCCLPSRKAADAVWRDQYGLQGEYRYRGDAHPQQKGPLPGAPYVQRDVRTVRCGVWELGERPRLSFAPARRTPGARYLAPGSPPS